MKDHSDLALLKRIRERYRARPKTELEKAYFSNRRLSNQEALEHVKQAQQKFKPKETQQISLFQTERS